MNRNELRVIDDPWDPTEVDRGTRPVTPEEFHQIATAEGYVKLDTDALVPLFRQGGLSGAYYPDDSGDPDGYFIPAQVLAALDGETT